MAVERDTSSDLWAITTYYNPAGYQRRRTNYTQFRRHLKVPLLAVELAPAGRSELKADDAELLVSLDGDDVLWQKERLLNIGLSHLPTHVKYVAWLDADVILPAANWTAQARAALETAQLVQLFNQVYHFERDDKLESFVIEPHRVTGTAIAQLLKEKNWSSSKLHPTTGNDTRSRACGLAWAARRELLTTHGWYEAMICGSGDRAMVLAACAYFEEARAIFDMDDRRQTHYLAWARPFYAAVQGRLDSLSGCLLHLWHGDLANRDYETRHQRFARLDFDPTVDLLTAPAGHLQIRRERYDVQNFLREYFTSRREDG